MTCFFGFCQQKRWKTNCSNKSNIFGDIATFLQQMLGKKIKNEYTFKKIAQNLIDGYFHKNLSDQKCSKIIINNAYKKLSDLLKF